MRDSESKDKEIDTYEFGSIQEVELSEVSSSLSVSDVFEFFTLDSYSIT